MSRHLQRQGQPDFAKTFQHQQHKEAGGTLPVVRVYSMQPRDQMSTLESGHPTAATQIAKHIDCLVPGPASTDHLRRGLGIVLLPQDLGGEVHGRADLRLDVLIHVADSSQEPQVRCGMRTRPASD